MASARAAGSTRPCRSTGTVANSRRRLPARRGAGLAPGRRSARRHRRRDGRRGGGPRGGAPSTAGSHGRRAGRREADSSAGRTPRPAGEHLRGLVEQGRGRCVPRRSRRRGSAQPASTAASSVSRATGCMGAAGGVEQTGARQVDRGRSPRLDGSPTLAGLRGGGLAVGFATWLVSSAEEGAPLRPARRHSCRAPHGAPRRSVSRRRAAGRIRPERCAGSLRGDASTGLLPPASPRAPSASPTSGSAPGSPRWSSACLVWGLIIWCVVAYRRRKDDDGLARADALQHARSRSSTPWSRSSWSWCSSSTPRATSRLARHLQARPTSRSTSSASSGAGTSTTSTRTSTRPASRRSLTGEPGVEETLPTLYLPVNKRVEFELDRARRHPLVLGPRLPARRWT